MHRHIVLMQDEQESDYIGFKSQDQNLPLKNTLQLKSPWHFHTVIAISDRRRLACYLDVIWTAAFLIFTKIFVENVSAADEEPREREPARQPDVSITCNVVTAGSQMSMCETLCVCLDGVQTKCFTMLCSYTSYLCLYRSVITNVRKHVWASHVHLCLLSERQSEPPLLFTRNLQILCSHSLTAPKTKPRVLLLIFSLH